MTVTNPAGHAERFPMLTEAGWRRLRWLEEHPQAPRFNHLGVDRLSAAGAQRVAAFERDLRAGPRGWSAGSLPRWVTVSRKRAISAFCSSFSGALMPAPETCPIGRCGLIAT